MNGPYTDDAALTAILGPKCSECGYRSEGGNNHRPKIGETAACSRWVQPAATEES